MDTQKWLKIDLQKVHSDDFYQTYMASFSHCEKPRRFYFFCKRFGDILLSFLLLLVLSPLLLLIALLIKLDSRGPVLFAQKRVGKDGRLFTCYKFRTMHLDAPPALAKEAFFDAENYITRVGKLLRRSSLDELPQFFCCLVGTMSLIGPRPVVPSEKALLAMRKRMGADKVRPGISGLAQVAGRDEIPYQNKALLDGIYVKRAGFATDLFLVWQTFLSVLKCRGK